MNYLKAEVREAIAFLREEGLKLLRKREAKVARGDMITIETAEDQSAIITQDVLTQILKLKESDR